MRALRVALVVLLLSCGAALAEERFGDTRPSPGVYPPDYVIIYCNGCKPVYVGGPTHRDSDDRSCEVQKKMRGLVQDGRWRSRNRP